MKASLLSKSQLKPFQETQKASNHINHHFKIKVLKIFDFPSQKASDSFAITYTFPTFDKPIESETFSLKSNAAVPLDTKSNNLITLSKEENIHHFLMSQTKGITISLINKYPQPKTVASTLIPIYDFLDLLENIDFKNFEKSKNKS